MSLPHWLALATLLIGVPLNVYVTWSLWQLSRKSWNVVLRERAVAASFVLIVVALYGFVFVNNDITPPPIDFEATKYLTRFGMLAVALVPALYWLRLFRR
jgi:hypothetical protein